MGQQLPQTTNPVIRPDRADQFESKYVQRVKETPFIDAELYTSDPLVFVDGKGPSLHELVKPRLGTKQLFPEEEIEKVMVSVLGGLKDLDEAGFEGHGDVCLSTVYYSPKDKSFRLAHPMFNQSSGYLLAKNGKRFSTLSPQQLSALAQQSEESQVTVKSDIFCFGVMMCEVCTLTSSDDIYCPDSYSIFHLEIQKRLTLIEEYYSSTIANIVKECLVYDPEERPDPYQLYNQITNLRKVKSRTVMQPPPQHVQPVRQ